jgi:hypothetical protein
VNFILPNTALPPFGSYIKAHNVFTITNTMQLCMFSGIFLGPTGNCQGTHKDFDINTSVIKKPRTVTPLHMPEWVISIVLGTTTCKGE